MRRSACIALVVASAAMLSAGISTRGARADRSVDGQHRQTSVLLRDGVALQRPQQGPRSALQRLPAQRAADLLAVAAIARHPTGPDGARQVRDGEALEQNASLETAHGRKMRALSLEPFEIQAVPVLAQDNRNARGRTGVARVVRAVGEKDELNATTAMPAGQTVFRFDRVVININLAGFGS